MDPVERQIREAMDRGEFDALPGAGKPLADLDRQYDPSWWARRWVERARVEDEAAELRRLVRREAPRLKASSDREGALRRVEELNQAIAAMNQRLDEADWIQPLEH